MFPSVGNCFIRIRKSIRLPSWILRIFFYSTNYILLGVKILNIILTNPRPLPSSKIVNKTWKQGLWCLYCLRGISSADFNFVHYEPTLLSKVDLWRPFTNWDGVHSGFYFTMSNNNWSMDDDSTPLFSANNRKYYFIQLSLFTGTATKDHNCWFKCITV